MNLIVNKCIEYVKEYFKNESSGHDFYHTLRVYNTAKKIAILENADVEIVMLAALLHDVDDIKISPNTYKNKDHARCFLKENNVDINNINLITQIIEEVSYKGTDSVIPFTIEGKIVQDADRLDAIGAIGIARAFAYGGNHNRVMYDPNIVPNLEMNEEEYRNHVSTTINHFYEKLFNLKDLMNTNKGKQLAISKDEYMRDFVEHFLEEWEGN